MSSESSSSSCNALLVTSFFHFLKNLILTTIMSRCYPHFTGGKTDNVNLPQITGLITGRNVSGFVKELPFPLSF